MASQLVNSEESSFLKFQRVSHVAAYVSYCIKIQLVEFYFAKQSNIFINKRIYLVTMTFVL